MNQQSPMTLHLQQPLVYTKERALNNSLPLIYDELLDLLVNLKVTSEALLVCEAELTSDYCKVTPLTSYIREANDQSSPLFSLEAGKYLFHQIPIPPNEGKYLFPLLNRFALSLDYKGAEKKRVMLRIFKERPFQNAVQLIAPI